MASPNKELLSFSLSFLNLLVPLLVQATSSNTTPGSQVVAVPAHSLQLLLLSLMPVLCASLASVMLDLALPNPAAVWALDVVAAAHAVVFLVFVATTVLPTTRLVCALGVYLSIVLVVAMVLWFLGVGGASRADDNGSSAESSLNGRAAVAVSSHHENTGQGGSRGIDQW